MLDGNHVRLNRHTGEKNEFLVQGPTLPLGSWTSRSISYNVATPQQENIDTDMYSVTFHQDGTFSAILDAPVAGTWEMNSVNLNSGEGTWIYHLFVEDRMLTMVIFESGFMDISDYSQNITYYFTEKES